MKPSTKCNYKYKYNGYKYISNTTKHQINKEN